MTALTVLIPAALVLGLAGLVAFIWSLKSGQFDDLDGAAERILLHDKPAERKDSAGTSGGRETDSL